MTDDIRENHKDNKLPILDLKCWTEIRDGKTIIFHDFYKKPMASKTSIRSKTSMPSSQIRSILVEEGLRRMRNVTPSLPEEYRNVHLTDFAKEMMRGGHTENYRKAIIEISTQFR